MHIFLLTNPNPNLNFPPSLRNINNPARLSFSSPIIGATGSPLLPTARPISPCVRALRSEMNLLDDKRSHTMMEYFGKTGADVGDDMAILIAHLEYACKRIAALVASPFNLELGRRPAHGEVGLSSSGRDAPKPLDIVSEFDHFSCSVNHVQLHARKLWRNRCCQY